MADNEQAVSYFKKLAQTEPILPVISDHPLNRQKAFNDRFDLCLKLGPVFDIIRHPETQTPTSIAIYGEWGTGKTSSMEWLEGLINEWNNNGTTSDKITVRTVWFYPWKYYDKNDVWRGLIAEVILKGLEVKGANIERVAKAAKQFGLFLGKGFLHTLAAIKLKAGSKAVAGEAEFDLSCIKDIITEYDRNVHPEKAFLNEFETSFQQWLTTTLGNNERMVIFIDDLDRCMPQVALGVLEALKLYLNIEGLIFIVGVDKNVIDPLVRKHYNDLGLDDYKSGHYLAKMFQTEVTVGPSEDQIISYLNNHLDNIEYFDKHLEENEKKLFHSLINDLAERNPREVKRLINSAIMSGAGVEMLRKAGDDHADYSFKQGMQIFFIRKVLEKDYAGRYQNLLGAKRANNFFSKWSAIEQQNIEINEDLDFDLSDHIPHVIPKYKDTLIDTDNNESLQKIPPEYRELANEYKRHDLTELLFNKKLKSLMQIEFSERIAKETNKIESSGNDDAILESIGEKLNKDPKEITEEDYSKIEDLDLSCIDTPDISFLENLNNLKYLTLEENRVSDISCLKNLTQLEQLFLCDTQVSNISALKKTITLQGLWLDNSLVKDISVLKNLKKLQILSLSNTSIKDFSVIENLINLERLYLSSIHIENISFVKKLKKLKWLNLSSSKITDLADISSINTLIKLSLSKTEIRDISYIESLKKLERLYLSKTNIEDISALKGLSNLKTLIISHTEIKNISHIKGLNKLVKLSIASTKVSDISVLNQLENIRWLSLSQTPIQDISILKKLKKMRYLNIKECSEISKSQIKELKNNLPNLKIIN
ncbi:MAG: P-loop NTPase fold protein [Sedimentisphaeraceae bacterium JB056]